jgi:hypothetical protein
MHLHLQHVRVPTIHQSGMLDVPTFYSLFSGSVSSISVLGIAYSCVHVKQKLNKRTEQISVALTPVSSFRGVCISNLGPVTSYPN